MLLQIHVAFYFPPEGDKKKKPKRELNFHSLPDKRRESHKMSTLSPKTNNLPSVTLRLLQRASVIHTIESSEVKLQPSEIPTKCSAKLDALQTKTKIIGFTVNVLE